jgi:hypothetical protein
MEATALLLLSSRWPVPRPFTRSSQKTNPGQVALTLPLLLSRVSRGSGKMTSRLQITVFRHHGLRVQQVELLSRFVRSSSQPEHKITQYMLTQIQLAYNPTLTPLLEQIWPLRSQGWIDVTGLQVLPEQGFAQFELFTGRTAPQHLMRAKVAEYGRECTRPSDDSLVRRSRSEG